MFCPNRRQVPNPGDHDPNCDLCDGTGWMYVQPTQTQMLVQGTTLEQTFYIQGRFDTGLATISSLAEDRVGYWDRVTLQTSVVRYTELIQRSENGLEDRLRYKTLSVLALQYKTKTFTFGRDFRVIDDKLIWTANESVRPKAREFYSILTERRPVYIVLNLMKHHRDVYDSINKTATPMPQQSQAKLDFLVRDESKTNQAPVAPQSPFQGGS